MVEPDNFDKLAECLLEHFEKEKKARREALSQGIHRLVKTHSQFAYVYGTDSRGVTIKGFQGCPPEGLTIAWEVLDNPDTARRASELLLQRMKDLSAQVYKKQMRRIKYGDLYSNIPDHILDRKTKLCEKDRLTIAEVNELRGLNRIIEDIEQGQGKG